MKQLIKKQAIFIDDHKRGVAHSFFDDPAADIHLDKKAKEGEYRIKIPLNSNRPINVDKKEGGTIPRSILEEIQSAFKDGKKRERFVKDLVSELKNFPYRDDELEYDTEGVPQKAFAALKRISKHFDLGWSEETVKGYLKEYKCYGTRYIATITDGPDLYYFSYDTKQIIAADYMMINLQDKRQWQELPARIVFPNK